MPLTVRVGPNRDPRSLQRCPVNNDHSPIAVSSEHFEGLVTVRVQNHLPSSSSSLSSSSSSSSSLSPPSSTLSLSPSSSSSSLATCPYFDKRTRLFSLQWQGQFRATNPARSDGIWTGDDVLFVAETEESVKVPRGTSLATHFVRLIDPSFVADAMWNKHRPWVGSPLVSGMNVLRVWKASENDDHGQEGDCDQEGRNCDNDDSTQPRKKILKNWTFYGLNRLEEDNVDLLLKSPDRAGSQPKEQPTEEPLTEETTTIASPTKSWWWTTQTSNPTNQTTPTTTSREKGGRNSGKNLTVAGLTSYQRRRFFTKREHRQAALLDPSLVVAGDFFNNFTDFENSQARVVISIQFDQVLRGQPLRFVCKSRAKQDRSTVLTHTKGNQHDPRHEAVALENHEDIEQAEEDAAVFFVVELQWSP